MSDGERWTFETLLEHLRERIADVRNENMAAHTAAEKTASAAQVSAKQAVDAAFAASEKATGNAFAAASKATDAAFASAEKATDKAEANQKAVDLKNNEYREQLKEQNDLGYPRKEGELRVKAVEDRTAALEAKFIAGTGERRGSKETWAYLVATISVLTAIAVLVAEIMKKR